MFPVAWGRVWAQLRGAGDAQHHGLAVTGLSKGIHLGSLCFSCVSEERTGALPTPGPESLAAALEGLGRAVL